MLYVCTTVIMVILNSFTVPNALVQTVPELSERNGPLLSVQKMLSETSKQQCTYYREAKAKTAGSDVKAMLVMMLSISLPSCQNYIIIGFFVFVF